MATKEEYLAKLKSQLDNWQVEVDQLEARAVEATDEIKAEINEQIANLRVKFSEGEGKFNELTDATEEAWEELKDDAEAMFDKLAGEFQEDAKEAVATAQGFLEKIKALFRTKVQQ